MGRPFPALGPFPRRPFCAFLSDSLECNVQTRFKVLVSKMRFSEVFMSEACIFFLGFLASYTLVVLALLGRRIQLKISREGIQLLWDKEIRK